MTSRATLRVAVPNLDSYRAGDGIGRVFTSLASHWGEQVSLADATFRASKLPLLRNFPSGVEAPAGTSLVLLPKLTGAQALANTGGIPGLAVVHDIGIVDFPGDREGVSWLTRRAILRSFRGLEHASAVIAVSEFTRQRLIHYLPEIESRVRVVANGVAPLFLIYNGRPGEARGLVTRQAGAVLGQPLLVYVGSESPRKNIALLLAVLRRVKEYHPLAQLLKVGQPGLPAWRQKTMAAARQLGLAVGRDLILLDGADDEVIASAYRSADVFVSASLYEGFGLPALEAMAVGTPVVVSNRGAFPEVVGKAGVVVEPELDAFTRAVMAVIANPPDEARRCEASQHAASFSWRRAAATYLGFMRGLADERCPSNRDSREQERAALA